MSVAFLSPEWASGANELLQNHEGFQNSIPGVELRIQFKTTDAPSGDVDYYLEVGGGSATLSLGEVADADATITQTYETATAIAKGELNTQTAFMTGKIKVSGNLAKLMMNQAVIQHWGDAVSRLDVEY